MLRRHFRHGPEVLDVATPHRLVHRWGGDVLSWTIVPDESGAVLELRQSGEDRATYASLALGWQVCLARVAAEDGTDGERPTGHRSLAYGWQKLHEGYQSDFSR